MSTANDRTYPLQGMTCGHCELSVREEVQELAGVQSVQADHTTGRLTVRGPDIDDGAIRAAGYLTSGLAVTGGDYRLEVDRRFFTAGQSAPLSFRITDARGHVVRDESERGPAAHLNEVPFAATFPTPGRYRLLLQIKAGGQVRTVAFTLEVPR